MAQVRNEWTALVSAATRVGGTLTLWSQMQDARSSKLAHTEISYFGTVRRVVADVHGGEPDANAIDRAYRRWLRWSDRPSLKVAAARAARAAYCKSAGDLTAALAEWRRVMQPPPDGNERQLVLKPSESNHREVEREARPRGDAPYISAER